MISKNYYKILELETNKVTPEEIKLAYRNVAKKNHPDVNNLDKLAEEKIKDINEAYKILSNPASKRKYDRIWNVYNRSKTKKFNRKTEEGSIVKMFFGNMKEDIKEKLVNKEVPVKGKNIETKIDISIEEAYYGLEKNIELKDAEGKNKIFKITIPKGIKRNESIRLVGQGKKGLNSGSSGDLLIKINIVDNEDMRLSTDTIYANLYITPWEAIFGADIDFTILGENINIRLPKGTQSGHKITVENKGYGNETRGKLIVETKIVVPEKQTNEELEMYNKLKQISKFNPRQECY